MKPLAGSNPASSARTTGAPAIATGPLSRPAGRGGPVRVWSNAGMEPRPDRRQHILEVLDDAFGDLMEADPDAFRVKYRKMAADPFAFYRGTACLFYADVTTENDPWVDDETARIWVHGDLHVENFGTYLNSDGRLVFDVNDFDEAYVGHFTWDVKRFVAGLALVGWRKALPERTVRDLAGRYLAAYLDQVDAYAAGDDSDEFALHLGNAEGPVLDLLTAARCTSRVDLLDTLSSVEDGRRRLRPGAGVRALEPEERERVEDAFTDYLATIPASKRFDRDIFYRVNDAAQVKGIGIGSAGLTKYTLLVEGYSEALDNDVVLSMKRANTPAVSRFTSPERVEGYFEHEGHRTVVSQRALQLHTDPLLGHTTLDGVGYVVSEVSPYEVDLEWDAIDHPDDIASLVDSLGRATAKVHCASDEDSDQTLVDAQVEQAVVRVLDGRRAEFVEAMTDFGIGYADRVRADHATFVDAFREGDVGIDSFLARE